MAEAKSITIIGGGLAGLALGIGLRGQGVPVTIQETGKYPRHRVCGEFISGRGQLSMARLGLSPLFAAAGAVEAQTVALFSATRCTAPRRLPSGAVCLSRFLLDAAMATRFSALGGILQEGCRFAGEYGEGVVRATGRRPQAVSDGHRWFGLKIHARNVPLVADLEVHVSSLGYVGLCRIGGDTVNVCGLFRQRADVGSGEKIRRDLLWGGPGSPLRTRLAQAEFEADSFCAVAGLSLQPQRAATQLEVCVGDTITMIPPITGNGMSMAFESAEIALPPLLAWSRGERSWSDTHRTIARNCDLAFAPRLAWAEWLQKILLTPALQDPFIDLAARSDWLWPLVFARTR